MIVQGGENLTYEPVRQQEILESIQGHDRCRLPDEGGTSGGPICDHAGGLCIYFLQGSEGVVVVYMY